MQMSFSMDVIWNLAMQEALLVRFKEIEPEHFFEALLKFAELTAADLQGKTPGPLVTAQVAAEAEQLRQELARRNIDATACRQALRLALGEGPGQLLQGETMHRSAESRTLFDRAARKAAENRHEILTASVLLETILLQPTPAMKRVLKGTELDRLGVLPTAGTPSDADTPAARVLVQVIQESRRLAVLLVGERPVENLIAAIAPRLSASSNPGGPRRLRSVTLAETVRGSAPLPAALGTLLQEAKANPDLLIWFPALDDPAIARRHPELPRSLRELTQQHQVRWVGQLRSSSYRDWLEREPLWQRTAHPIWLLEPAIEIPQEI
jgi:hypothetical protein